MSYLDPNQDQQQQQQPSGSQAPAGNQAPSTSGAVGGASTSRAYSPTTATSGTAGTSFQNLQNYLTANQGSQLSNQLAGNIQNTANQAQNEFNTAQNSFKQGVDQNTVNYDQNNVQSTLANPQNASSADTAKFQAQLNANYQGPSDASQYAPWQQAQNDANTAYGQAQAAKTEGGKLSLLNQYFKTPSYSQGQNSLDSALLLGGDQSGFNKLQDSTQNIQSQFQTAGQGLNDYASKAATNTAAARQQARNAIGVDNSGGLLQTLNPDGSIKLDANGNPTYSGAIGNIQNAVNAQVAADKTNFPKEYADAQQALGLLRSNSTGNMADLSKLSADEKAGLGSFANYTGPLYSNGNGVGNAPTNFNPGQYLQQNAVNPTANNVISAPDQAKLQALYGLAGIQNNFAPGGGTAPTPFTFNSDQAMAQLQTNKADYEKALAASKSGSSIPQAAGMDIPDAIAWEKSQLQNNPSYVNHPTDPNTQEMQADYNRMQSALADLQKQWGAPSDYTPIPPPASQSSNPVYGTPVDPQPVVNNPITIDPTKVRFGGTPAATTPAPAPAPAPATPASQQSNPIYGTPAAPQPAPASNPQTVKVNPTKVRFGF